MHIIFEIVSAAENTLLIRRKQKHKNVRPSRSTYYLESVAGFAAVFDGAGAAVDFVVVVVVCGVVFVVVVCGVVFAVVVFCIVREFSAIV